MIHEDTRRLARFLMAYALRHKTHPWDVVLAFNALGSLCQLPHEWTEAHRAEAGRLRG